MIRFGRLLASLFSFPPFGAAGCRKTIFGCSVGFSPTNLIEPLRVVVGADVSGDLARAANHMAQAAASVLVAADHTVVAAR
jgi:hypothetical protein